MMNHLIEIFRLRQNIILYIALSIITYIIIYLKSFGFGLYEDDWNFVLTGYHRDIGSAFGPLVSMPQGRPVGFFIAGLLSHFGAYTESIQVFFFFGALMLGANALLIYLIFKKYVTPPVAIAIAAVYLLIPIDTTRAFITHIFFIHTGTFIALLSVYLSQKYHYVFASLIAASFVTYEPIAPAVLSLFFVFALIDRRGPIGQIKALAISIAACLLVAILRILVVQDSRIGELDFSIYSFLISPFEFWVGSIDALITQVLMGFSQPTLISAIAVSFLVATLMVAVCVLVSDGFWKANASIKDENIDNSLLSKFSYYRPISLIINQNVILLICGLFVSLSGLVFAFQQGSPPLGLRASRYYAGAIFGLAVMIVAFGQIIGITVFRRRSALAAAFTVAASALLLVPANWKTQSDYRQAWAEQAVILEGLLHEVERVRPNLVIVLSMPADDRARAINSFSRFGYAYAVRALYDWPTVPGSERPRVLANTRSDWWAGVRFNESGEALVPGALSGPQVVRRSPMQAGNVIHLWVAQNQVISVNANGGASSYATLLNSAVEPGQQVLAHRSRFGRVIERRFGLRPIPPLALDLDDSPRQAVEVTERTQPVQVAGAEWRNWDRFELSVRNLSTPEAPTRGFTPTTPRMPALVGSIALAEQPWGGYRVSLSNQFDVNLPFPGEYWHDFTIDQSEGRVTVFLQGYPIAQSESDVVMAARINVGIGFLERRWYGAVSRASLFREQEELDWLPALVAHDEDVQLGEVEG